LGVAVDEVKGLIDDCAQAALMLRDNA